MNNSFILVKMSQARQVIAAISLPLLLCACGSSPDVIPVENSDRPVKLIRLSGATSESSARFPAVINAGETAEISFLVGGSIESLLVTDAQEVASGDVIARLGAQDFESNLASARASFTNTEEEYQRAVRLAAQDAIAQNVLKQRETQRDVAKAQLESAEKALADSVLRAPFSGVVANVAVREKQTIAAGTTVATIIDLETLEATINLPASVIAQVPTRRDQDRGAVVILEAAADLSIPAVYSEADLVADATSQTYAVTFKFAAPEDMLVLPGMNATVILNSAPDQAPGETVAVPLAAVQSDGDGQYVWLVNNESMTVTRRNIEIEPGIGESVAVTAGLSRDDQIVGAGGAYLAEGVKVSPWSE